MARRNTSKDYKALREASGWYAAAWRDYRRLSGEELADEVGTSRGMISDLENGKRNFTSEWVERFGKALGVSHGHLLDLNPFDLGDDGNVFVTDFAKLDERDRLVVLNTLNTLLGTKAS